MIAWKMSYETALEFYRRAEEAGAKTEKERVKILMQMVEEGLITGMTVTNKSKDQYVEDLKKNFNVFDVRDIQEKHEGD